MVQPDRPRDNIIRRMRFAGWIIKTTAHARNVYYNNHCFSAARMVTGTRLNITFIGTTLSWLTFTHVLEQTGED